MILVSNLRAHAALILSILLTIVIQAVVCVIAFGVPVMAPAIAADRGLDPALIGLYPVVMYGASMVICAYVDRLLRRFGAMGLSVLCIITCAAGLCLLLVPSPAMLAIAALVIGAGYGPVTPASSQILGARAPRGMVSLIFSIKQTGTPLGGFLAGALVPTLIVALTWPYAALAIAAGALLIGLALLPFVRSIDAGNTMPAVPARRLLYPVLWVFQIAPLRPVVCASFTFAGMQVCLISFLTVFLVSRIGLDLVTAGALLGASQIASVIGRLVWGFVADQLLAPMQVIRLLALLMSALAVAVGSFTAAWPLWTMFAVCALYGATAMGWNGVLLSEIARLAPPGETGMLTSGAMMFNFLGVLVGPLLFSAALSVTGDYRAGFFILAAFTLAGTGLAMWSRGDKQASPQL